VRKSRRPVVWEIEDLQGTSRPWDWRTPRSGGLQGYLTIFTINNVVRELVGELDLRSVEAFLRSVERHLGGLPGLMKTFKLR
jgi:hypothetical protein